MSQKPRSAGSLTLSTAVVVVVLLLLFLLPLIIAF